MVIILSLNMINLLKLDAQYQPIITKLHDQIQHENNLKVTKLVTYDRRAYYENTRQLPYSIISSLANALFLKQEVNYLPFALLPTVCRSWCPTRICSWPLNVFTLYQ